MENDDRLALLAERLPQLVWFTRPDGYHEYFNQRWYNLTGMTSDQCRGEGWKTAVHPDDLGLVRSRWRQALEAEELYEAEYRLRRADGTYCWMLSRALADRDTQGNIIRWFGTSTNIDAQKHAEAALSHLEEQHRLALEAANLGTWSLDIESHVATFDATTRTLMSIPSTRPESMSLDEVMEFVHPSDREVMRKHIATATGPQSDGHYEIEYRVIRADGGIRWIRSSGKVFFPRGDNIRHTALLSSVVRDSTEQHAFEETQQLLTRELHHRVKNLFAIANGMVSMTARAAKDPKEMALALRGRLGALSRAHELVQPPSAPGQRGEAEVALGQLIDAVLAPYKETEGKRVTVEGPDIRVGSSTTTSLALVLHELATNAAKYGCLSNAEGHLTIRWALQDGNVKLDWIETSGPSIEAPPHFEGFGSQLTQRSIAGQLGGTLEREWRREGLCVHMHLPLARLAG